MSGTGRPLVVVGGASGIGAACVEMARDAYEHVVVIDLAGPPRAPHGTVRYLTADATDADAIEEAFEDLRLEFGGVEAVISMVGGATPRPFLDYQLDDWESEVRFNLTSAFVVSRAALRVMTRQETGSLVLASSGFATRPGPGRVAYAAAKSGVLGLARSLAAEFGGRGLRVNVVSPGPTDTPRFRKLLTEDEIRSVREQSVLVRLSEPSDVAAAALFLASPAARQITGQVLHVDGGTYFSP